MRPMLLSLALALLLPAAAGAQKMTNRFVVTPEGQRVPLRMQWLVLPYWGVGLSGAATLQYTYYLDAEGEQVLHGKLARRFPRGRAVEFTTYVHGVRNGPFQTAGPRFRLQSEGTYRNDELEGEVTFYYESGAVKKTETYSAGVLNGPYRAFYEDGTLEQEAHFRDGRKEGPVTGYHPNGAVAYRGTFRDGYLTGAFQTFDRQGRKVAEGTLEREWIVGDWRCFGPDGDLGLVRDDCDHEYYTRCSCP